MIAVIYWSGTGNTAAMAEAVGKGIADAGQEVVVKSVSEITADEAANYEELEDGEFAPFYEALEPKLAGKKVVLFGSYGWGGSWLDDWAGRVEGANGVVVDKLPVMGEPDDSGKEQCEALGKALVNA